MSTKDFVLALARGARGKDAAKALILPQIFGGTGYVNAGTELTVSGTPPLSLPNSLGKPLKAWSVDVLPYQEGTGDPSPSNVRAIHGTDKVNLYCGSPNIWDEEWELGAISESTGENVADNIRLRSKNLIPVLPNTRYYISGVRAKIYYYDASGAFLSATSSFYGPDFQFTTDSNVRFIRWQSNNQYGTTYNHDISINYPSTVTAYNPHQGGTTSITLPQTVYTGTIGSEGGESRWGEVDLGALTWIYNNTEYSYGYFQAMISDKKQAEDNNFLCESYANATGNRASLQNNQIARRNNTSSNICIRNDTYTDVESFVQSLQGIKLIYELATPTTFAVPSPTIPTPTGTASTWATAEDGTVDGMEVTYVGKA